MDRVTELERLERLRESGVLSYQEFLDQKAKLLDQLDRQGSGAWPKSLEEWQQWRWRRWVVGGSLIVTLGMIQAYKSWHRDGTPGAANTVAGDGISTASSQWTVETVRDPMTDEEARVASSTFATAAGTISMAIRCKADGNPQYVATAFDGAGDAVEMRSDVDNDLQTFVSYEVRVGDSPPVRLKQTNPEYSNEVVIEKGRAMYAAFGGSRTLWVSSFFDAGTMVTAPNLRLQFHLTTGDATVVIDQTDAQLAQAMAPCVAHENDLVRQAEAANAARAAAERERAQMPDQTTTTNAM